jgi:integrase
MPQKKLTEKTIAGLKAPDPSGRQVMYWDTELKGFGVRVSGTTTDRAYIVQRAINGNTRRVTIGPCNVLPLADARVRAQAQLADFYRGIDPKAKRAASATLAAVLDDYLAAMKDLRPRTRESYRSAIHAHLKPWVNRPLSNITRDMVERQHAAIAAEIMTRQHAQAERDADNWEQRAKAAEKKGWLDAAKNHRARAALALKRKANSNPGQVTANNVMKVLRALHNFAADRHPEIGSNPVKLRRQWYPVEARSRHVSQENLPAFFQGVMQLESPVGRDYILLLLFTGLRRREAAALSWADLDLKARVVRIPAERTKGKRTLDLPLTDFVHDLLVARRSLGKTEYVFPANSRSRHVEEPKFHLNQIAKTTGIRISAHDLRRTFITIAESCNISPIALRALVNHSMGRDVTSKYVQMSVDRLREPAQIVTHRIKELCGIEGPKGKNVAPLRRRSERN